MSKRPSTGNRDARTYLRQHWTPAPPAVWFYLVGLLVLSGLIGSIAVAVL